jgi:hypothetical protein
VSEPKALTVSDFRKTIELLEKQRVPMCYYCNYAGHDWHNPNKHYDWCWAKPILELMMESER